MSIPIVYFLLVYLAVVAIFLVFAFFNIYHAWRFGFWDKGNFVVMIAYLLVLILIIILSIKFILSIDWRQTLDFYLAVFE